MNQVPHLPWAPQEAVQGLPPMGFFVPPFRASRLVMGPGTRFIFWREAHSRSFTAYVTCLECSEHWQAGASAGERKLIRWASDHACDAPQAEFYVDEDKRLFR